MMRDYFKILREIEKFCEDFKDNVEKSFFTTNVFGITQLNNYPTNNWFCYTPKYNSYYNSLQRIIDVCNLFAIKTLEDKQVSLRVWIQRLHDPEHVRNRNEFVEIVNIIKSVFSASKNEINNIINALHSDEIERLNESIHCLLENCYYSCISMAVTAIEFRLLNYMKVQNPAEAKKLDDKTLGGLIKECLENMDKYLLPEKYRPLLELCNTYRIFSVHPKKEHITNRVANAILNLAFEFLLDKEIARIAKITP